MDKFIHLFAKLGFWGFVLTSTVILAELILLLQSYFLSGQFVDTHLLMVGFVTTVITAFIFFTLTAFVLKRMRKQQWQLEQARQQESNAKSLFKQYLDIADVMLIAVDKDGKVTLANKMASDILGFKDPIEAIGKDWFKLHEPPEEYFQLQTAFKELINANPPADRRYENVITLKDGSKRLIDWKNEYIYSTDGSIIGSLWSGKDITQERKAQNELKAQRNLLRTVIDEIPDPVMLQDAQAKFLLVNQPLAALYQTTPEAMLGQDNSSFIEDQALAKSYTENAKEIMLKGQTEIVYEDVQYTESGDMRHYRAIKKPFKNAEGEDQLLVIAQDITEQKQNLKQLFILKEALQNFDDSYFLLNNQAQIISVNKAASRELGYSEEELMQMDIFEIDKNYPRQSLPDLWSEIKQKRFTRFETTHTRKNGIDYPVEIVSSFLEFEGIEFVMSTARNMTQSKLQQKQLKQERDRFSLAVEGSQDGIWEWNFKTDEIFFSTRYKEILGYNEASFHFDSHNWVELVYPEDIEKLNQDIQNHLKGKSEYFENKCRMIHADGKLVWVLARGKARFDENGRATHLVGFLSDISEQTRHQERLDHIAKHDVLTNLPNRFMLNELLQSLMSRSERSHSKLAVLYLDLDGFKEINDSYGHEIGDKVLVIISDRIRHCMRLEDLVARIGGDEFVLVFPDIEKQESVIPMIQRLLVEINKSMLMQDLHNQPISAGVSASIGVTFYPQDTIIGSDALLRQADQAMYQAKTSGKNQYKVFNGDH